MKVEEGIKVLWITIAINIVLSVLKIIIGIIGKSSVLVADGIHSMADVVTTFFAMLGIKISSRKADACHSYGHEKFEPIFANIVCLILILTGILLGYNSITKLFDNSMVVPQNITLIVAIISIFVKELMFWYTIRMANKLKSVSMKADAWHHRSDAISSVIALVGIYGAQIGYPFVEPLAGIVISILIIKIGVEFYLKAVHELVDASVSPELLQQIEQIVLNTPGVYGLKDIKSRIFGNKFYVDITITVDGNLPLRQAHDIAVLVHDAVERNIKDCKHCLIHVDPA